MKLRNPGKNILKTEVTNISIHGIWLIVEDTEYFLPYEDFPWFQNATIAQIHNVQLIGENHLHWPALDVDIKLESFSAPHKYPLIYK